MLDGEVEARKGNLVFPVVLFSSQENPRSGDKVASGGTWVVAPSVVNFKETVESLMAFHLPNPTPSVLN